MNGAGWAGGPGGCRDTLGGSWPVSRGQPHSATASHSFWSLREPSRLNLYVKSF